MDFNVYLYASKQLLSEQNIYADNPYNNYLYSPLFALILSPISIFDFSIGRVIWGIINFFLVVRLWKIISKIIFDSFNFNQKYATLLKVSVLIISLGFLFLNINLGQITIVILWLTIEGLFQIICCKKKISGAFLLALGINIKIIPLIGLFYLFFKWEFKACCICVLMVIASLFIPSFFVGHDYNMKMVNNWTETINPSNKKYVFEDNNLTQSLSALLPAYFYDFEEKKVNGKILNRTLYKTSTKTLEIIMQLTRVLLLFSSLFLVFYKAKKRNNKALYFFWEIAYLALVSALIFPHQQKYAMLYFVPAGTYMICFILLTIKLNWKVHLKHKTIAVFACFLMLLSALMGRDIIGNYLINIFDFYHLLGIINLLFVFFLLIIRPNFLLEMNRQLTKSN